MNMAWLTYSGSKCSIGIQHTLYQEELAPLISLIFLFFFLISLICQVSLCVSGGVRSGDCWKLSSAWCCCCSEESYIIIMLLLFTSRLSYQVGMGSRRNVRLYSKRLNFTIAGRSYSKLCRSAYFLRTTQFLPHSGH